MRKDGALQVPGLVSIWAGRLSDEGALDDYVSFRYPPDGESWSPFTRDHGLGWVDEDQAEAAWFAGGAYSLAGHSYGGSFAAAADVDLARRFPEANSVYLVYDFDASAALVSGSALLAFLGAYPYCKQRAALWLSAGPQQA
ncbi:immunity 22 family protein [Micromonospora sp. NPDC023956]|uniref:immunity 22 family protein n=1 Tax=Micromonospora sp. NPDC023956 TaxID=3155722 RepID=UPI003407A9F8